MKDLAWHMNADVLLTVTKQECFPEMGDILFWRLLAPENVKDMRVIYNMN